MTLRARAVTAITVITFLVAIVAAHKSTRATPDGVASDRADVSHLVILTEDNGVGENGSGCDAISIHDVRTLNRVSTGERRFSPARIAARPDLSQIVANHANNCGRRFLFGDEETNPNCEGWLSLRQSRSSSDHVYEDRILTGGGIATKAGIAYSAHGDLVVGTGAGRYDVGQRIIPARAPFGVSRYQLGASDIPDRVLSSPAASRRTDSLVGEVLLTGDDDVLLLVTIGGRVHAVDSTSLLDVRAPIAFPTPVAFRNRASGTMPPIEGFHATYSAEHGTLAIGEMSGAGVTLVHLASETVTQHSAGAEVEFVGGVSFNNGWISRGLLAIHAGDRIVIAEHIGPSRLAIVSEFAIPSPRESHRQLINAITGPLLSIEWSASGRYLIAASNAGRAEFVVIEVDEGTREMRIHGTLTACSSTGGDYANDIWTANGLLTPPASPTPTATASATPTLTPSPTHTDEPAATPTPTHTPTATALPTATTSLTPIPSPIYLPLALTESCDPTQVRIDVALVIDASSSMREPAAPGSARTKLEAATLAVGTFLDVLALDEGDQAAIVSFSLDAWLHAPLTADRDALDIALAAVEAGRQTRIDRGLEVATAALLDDATRDPDNEPVLVLLTDGRANPVPVDVAVGIANDAKSDSITIFTIGLGSDVEIDALRQMASEPAFFLQAPTAAELKGVYREVARSIPCPPSAYWGGR